MRIRLLLALLLASCMLLSMLTTAQNKQTCTCQCLGKESSAAVLKSGGEPKCQQQCARTCGGFTDCPTASGQKCSDCCDTYCNDGEKGYGGTYSEECKVSCKSACDFRKLVNGIRDIIYAAAGIVGALMLIIHGIRLAVSRDPRGRDDAKSSMWHVIIALIIIALAASLVDLFINIGLKPAPVGTSGTPSPGATPSPSGSPAPVTGGGIKDATAVYNKDSGMITFTVKFGNTGEQGLFGVDVLDASGNRLFALPNKEVAAHSEGTISFDVLAIDYQELTKSGKARVRLVQVDLAGERNPVTENGERPVDIQGLKMIPEGKIIIGNSKDYCASTREGVCIGWFLCDNAELRFKVPVTNNMDQQIKVVVDIYNYDETVLWASSPQTVIASGSSYDFCFDSDWNHLWSYASMKNEGYLVTVGVEGYNNYLEEGRKLPGDSHISSSCAYNC